MTKHLPEFPSDWHQERHIEDTKRELEGAKARLAELKAMKVDADMIALAEQAIENARNELKRLAPQQKSASKRPRATKETR